MFDPLIQDVRYSVRALAAKPGFTAAAVLTLALGIGANAAIFNATAALLLKPLPYPHSDRLVLLYDSMPKSGEDEAGSTVPDFLDQRAQAPALADSALFQTTSHNLSSNGAVERVRGLAATPSLFPTLGVAALKGRALVADDGVPGNDKVVVLSYRTWQNRYAGDPDIVGRDLRLDGHAYRIVGVMPQGFFFPDRDTAIWTPYAIRPEQRLDAERAHSDVESIGRLAPGATIAGLETQFRAISARNAARSPELRENYAATGFTMHARDLADDWFGGLKSALW
ncbi:MAG: ABC transporter permease, partial [Rhodanobacteraceae bacterium]